MPTIVNDNLRNRKYVLIGTGFGASKTARPNPLYPSTITTNSESELVAVRIRMARFLGFHLCNWPSFPWMVFLADNYFHKPTEWHALLIELENDLKVNFFAIERNVIVILLTNRYFELTFFVLDTHQNRNHSNAIAGHLSISSVDNTHQNSVHD